MLTTKDSSTLIFFVFYVITNVMLLLIIQQQYFRIQFLESQMVSLSTEIKELNSLLQDLKELNSVAQLTSLDNVSILPDVVNSKVIITLFSVISTLILLGKIVKTIKFFSSVLGAIHNFGVLPLRALNSDLVNLFLNKKEIIEFYDKDF